MNISVNYTRFINNFRSVTLHPKATSFLHVGNHHNNALHTFPELNFRKFTDNPYSTRFILMLILFTKPLINITQLIPPIPFPQLNYML